jgi:predicted permease
MLAATTWASHQCPPWKTPETVVTHPWFIATLFDCYFGFLTFYAWVCFKEPAWLTRLFWLVAILLLGNIAMSSYLLIQLFRLPANARVEQLLLRQRK